MPKYIVLLLLVLGTGCTGAQVKQDKSSACAKLYPKLYEFHYTVGTAKGQGSAKLNGLVYRINLQIYQYNNDCKGYSESIPYLEETTTPERYHHA